MQKREFFFKKRRVIFFNAKKCGDHLNAMKAPEKSKSVRRNVTFKPNNLNVKLSSIPIE